VEDRVRELIKMNRELFALLPTWCFHAPEGLSPTMYGTGSRQGDLRIVERVREIQRILTEEFKDYWES
jgi:hypothetical protein